MNGNGYKLGEGVETPQNVTKVSFSIGVKLILVISLIVIISLSGVTFLVSYFVSNDVRLNAEENNLTINSRTASECENSIDSTISAVEIFSEFVIASHDTTSVEEILPFFFEKYSDIGAMYFAKSKRSYTNKNFFIEHSLDESVVASYADFQTEYIEMAKAGSIVLKNASIDFETPMIAIFSPVQTIREEDVVVIYYSTETLFDAFSSGSINQSVFLNHEGEVLIHSNLDVMMNARDFKTDSVFIKMQDSGMNNMQTYFVNDDGSEYIGAYKKIKNTGSAVITTIYLDIVLESINSTTRRNLYLAIAILSISILSVWFFSRSISIPIRRLVDVADEINKANFNTDLFDELESQGRHDEIAVLIESTKNERWILNTLTRLTNIGVMRSVIQKKVDFDPHLKDITIFFSDIRGFTKISDEFNTRFGKNSGMEIIGFLNDYMTRMVQCVTLTGGVIDKFEGDAIMACWGVLRNDDLSFDELDDSDSKKTALKLEHEQHKVLDALSAIMATIAMRYALRKYNKEALAFTKKNMGTPNAKYKPEIKIGCGLNSGRATVGFMGSWEKMEFTSIGDSVNLASRTESSNKLCGTDILITQDTYNLLKRNFIKCSENNFNIKTANERFEIIVEKIPVAFEIKGKGKQYFYAVVNMPQFNVQEFFSRADSNFYVDEDCLDVVGPRGPTTLSQLRMLLGIPESDFGGVNLDQEESKIQVSAS